jgi:hypothetical protein
MHIDFSQEKICLIALHLQAQLYGQSLDEFYSGPCRLVLVPIWSCHVSRRNELVPRFGSQTRPAMLFRVLLCLYIRLAAWECGRICPSVRNLPRMMRCGAQQRNTLTALHVYYTGTRQAQPFSSYCSRCSQCRLNASPQVRQCLRASSA